MKIQISKIAFRFLSYLSDKTRGNTICVKYKLLIGTFLLSATHAHAQDIKAVTKDDSNRIPEAEITCYKPAPTILVKACVVDENGEELIGVTVKIKGDDEHGILTDQNGCFKIEALSKDILILSCLGFETREIKVSKIPAVCTITMKDSSNILCYDVVIIKR